MPPAATPRMATAPSSMSTTVVRQTPSAKKVTWEQQQHREKVLCIADVGDGVVSGTTSGTLRLVRALKAGEPVTAGGAMVMELAVTEG